MSVSGIFDRYDVVQARVDLGPEWSLELARVRDVDVLVDAMGPDDFGPDERMPYWAALWPSALTLARHLLEVPPRSAVLELGAGLGLVSVAAARAGAHVVACDYEPHALEFVRHNAMLNDVEVEARLWDWREPGPGGPYATIVAADVLYEERNAEPVARAIAGLLAADGEALVADPGRPHVPDFVRVLERAGFTITDRSIGDVSIMSATRDATVS